jgi:hypothetical protein
MKDPGKDKMEIYLGGIDCCENGDDKDLTFSALSWWKVSVATKTSNLWN